jgi:hypothetical protein
LTKEQGDVGRNLHASVGGGCAGNGHGHDQLAVRPHHAAGSSQSNIDLRLADIKPDMTTAIISLGSRADRSKARPAGIVEHQEFPST